MNTTNLQYKEENSEKDPIIYRIRIMSSIVAAEFLCLAMVLFWPVTEGENSFDNIYVADDVTQIQAPVRTLQESAPPPPPSPQVPIPVPNDEPIVEQDIEFPESIFSESFDSLSVTAGEGGEGDDRISGNPDTGPAVMRIEEPTFENRSPEKADIYVKFLVDTKGNVEDASIDKIFLYDNDRPSEVVDEIDAEVMQRTLKAALNWKFRPAKENGKVVRAYTVNIFTVDY
jgi:outer membrane biosynthesis protein TonB